MTGSPACAGRTAEMYSTGKAGIERAKRICDGCELAAPCLAQALENREDAGVWGGTDEDERKAILKARRAAS